MLAAVLDHLWQSIVCAAIVAGVTYLVRRNSAALQLWLWRIAAAKFLVPFSLLFGLGGWLGFPVRHSAIPPPPAVIELVSRGLSMAAPARTLALRPPWTALASILLLAAAAATLWAILRRLKHAQRQRDAEAARMAADFHFQPAPLKFWQSTLLASVALVAASLPLIGGAVRDRLWRQQILAVDQQALLAAKIVMTEAPRGIGSLSRVTAGHQGVVIRNINIQDLVSMVYGIGKFEVFGGAMPWLEYPRYDVRVTGPVRAPEVFDPYSLRQPVTHYLYDQFGVSIRVNGTCQQPCKDYESFVIERLPRCTRLLGAHPECG
jgi:hypothetical protein